MEPGETNIFTRRETLQHNTIDDCWLIINNNVYDFTPFIKLHPGGTEILMSRAGEEATSYFLGKHGKSPALFLQLEQLKIGELPAEEQIPVEAYEEPFFIELISRSYSEKLYVVSKRARNKFFWIRFANISIFFLLSGLALFGNLPWWTAVFFVFIQAIIGTSLFGLVAHEATHRNFPKDKSLKQLLNITWPVFWPFISQNALRYEHNSHHIKIGDPEYDYEVAAFASFIRYSGNVTPNALHQYQHKLAKYIYPFYANIITTIGGFTSTFWTRHNRKVIVEHTVSIFMTMAYYVVFPAMLTGGSTWWFLLLYLIYQCVLYYGIYIGAAINHFVPQVISEIPEVHKNKFGYYVCHNTTNFCTNSKFWNWYTGGFNVQIEHHLIPFIPVENLERMIPIVKELCIKYNYPYYSYEKVMDLWNAHYDFLRMMSIGNNEAVIFEKTNKEGYQAR